MALITALAPPDCQTFPTAGPDKNLHAKISILRITKKNHAKIVSLTGFLLLAQLYYAANHFVTLGIWDQDSD